MDVLRSIEGHALAQREECSVHVTTEIDGLSPVITRCGSCSGGRRRAPAGRAHRCNAGNLPEALAVGPAAPDADARARNRWHRLLATVRWIDERQLLGMYIRQVDAPGVDTKFIERNRGVLTELLDLQLPPSSVDTVAPDFERRYGFRRKPAYVRFGVDDCDGWRELTVRAEDFAAPPAGIARAYVVDNEITYLAIPCPRRAMLVLGGGYAVPVLESLGWLAGLDLVCWGDIDTHGFAILDRMRQGFPRVRSMLMDRTTLLVHQDQWVTEPAPAASSLEFPDGDEAALYADLVADGLGRSVRLEQERIRYGIVERAMLNGGDAWGPRRGWLAAEP